MATVRGTERRREGEQIAVEIGGCRRKETDRGKDDLKTNQVGARKRLGTLTKCRQNF